jgi:flagellar assembly protein FliH
MSSESASRGVTLQSEPFQYVPTAEHGLANGEADGPWTQNGASAKTQMEKAQREGYERGLRDGEARASKAFEARTTVIQEGVNKALKGFLSETEEYFNRVEPELVQLALAIARKILHREVQIDPLLLTGLVHVALEKLGAGTRVRLRANPADIHFWNEYFARAAQGGVVPELVGDAALPQGECALETEVGSTQISLDTQLKEIEQGFFDLLEQRPRVR